ncbi:exported hypothetical protein [Desulfamplus magnetovallimortis]|uniref:Leucine-binding protein domain-containing protein n=1 Tax=Desulfamplus magnetovallimortis TaxID=1246637 RepID=A0A1W1H7V5_9BACT|nr:ABC transporter substrate-binding protein [Desulfamplus magnetovallimortis]SLM28557.1 exported hypothetical protein [Desulfamplus magnetovallimortis]
MARKLIKSLLFLITIFLFLSTISCTENASPVRVGAALVLTGPASYVGEEIRDGLIMAVEEINERGGINGRAIELVIEDATAPPPDGLSSSGNFLDPGKSAFDALEEKNPIVIVSSLSSLSIKLAPIAEKRKRLMVGLVATAPELTKTGDWVYRYWPTAEHEAPPLAELFEQLGHTTKGFGVIYLDDAYGTSVFRDLEKRCKAFGSKIVPAPFPLSGKKFSAEVELIKETSAVCVIGFDVHIINILKALREIGYQGDIISTTTATLPSVTSIPEAENVYVTAPAIYNKNFHFTDEIKNRYNQKFGKPFTQYSANGYDFIYILSGILEDQPVTMDALKGMFEKGFVYSGVFGNIELKSGKKDILFPIFPAQIINGNILFR